MSSTPFCCHTCGVHAHLQIKCGNHTKLCSVHAHFMRLVWLAHHILSTYTLYPVGVISTQNIECSLKVYTCNTCSVQTQVTSTPSTYGVHAHFRSEAAACNLQLQSTIQKSSCYLFNQKKTEMSEVGWSSRSLTSHNTTTVSF